DVADTAKQCKMRLKACPSTMQTEIYATVTLTRQMMYVGLLHSPLTDPTIPMEQFELEPDGLPIFIWWLNEVPDDDDEATCDLVMSLLIQHVLNYTPELSGVTVEEMTTGQLYTLWEEN